MNLETPTIPNCRVCNIRSSWNGCAYACPECGEICTNDPTGGPLSHDGSTTLEDIVEYAKTWIGVPYTHLGRSRENGIDCIGLLRSVATHFDLSNHDYFNYAPTPDGKTLIRELDRAFGVDTGYEPGRPFIDSFQPGDVLTFWIRKRTMPKHAGIYVKTRDGRDGILHTYSTLGKVTMHGMNQWWLDRICKVYHWPGVSRGGE